MGRLLAILLAACVFVLPASGQSARLKKGPGRAETRIVQFIVTDINATSGECARWYSIAANGIACSIITAIFPVGVPWAITRLELTLLSGNTMSGAEACDVDVGIGGVTAATFQMGAAGLRASGETASITNLAVSAASATDTIIVRHDNPVPDTYCVDGASCLCDGVNSGWTVSVYGFIQ